MNIEPKPEQPEEPDYGDDERNDFDDDWRDDDDYEQDEFETAMGECGQMRGGGCMLAGTEHCDFECPFSAAMYRNLGRKRDAKGKFCKDDSG